MLATSLFSGLLGLVFYEGLRIYKCTTVGKHPVPNNRLGWHALGLSILGVVSASLSYQFAEGQFMEGVILGFAVPSGLKAVLARESGPSKGDDMWSDGRKSDATGSSSKFAARARSWIVSYFDSRQQR
jgi:hypothetical protein